MSCSSQHLKWLEQKHTVRKALDGAAVRTVQASKNIAVKAPRKPTTHTRCKREEGFRPWETVCTERKSGNTKKSTDLLIRRAPFQRVVNENCEKFQGLI